MWGPAQPCSAPCDLRLCFWRARPCPGGRAWGSGTSVVDPPICSHSAPRRALSSRLPRQLPAGSEGSGEGCPCHPGPTDPPVLPPFQCGSHATSGARGPWTGTRAPWPSPRWTPGSATSDSSSRRHGGWYKGRRCPRGLRTCLDSPLALFSTARQQMPSGDPPGHLRAARPPTAARHS